MSNVRHRPRADGWQGECDDAVAAFLVRHLLGGLDPDADPSDAGTDVLLARLDSVRNATCVADCALDVLYRLRSGLWTALEAAGVGRADMAERSGVDRNVIDQAFYRLRRDAAKSQ